MQILVYQRLFPILQPLPPLPHTKERKIKIKGKMKTFQTIMLYAITHNYHKN